ncbi:MAG TPA: mechanosensitive ion channel domain-containing protein [Verrucomicrobiae bacterium]|nr:mechanosensitive ion channel domain-containing protein [Verrucomicrobiae bacterium]
MNASSGNGFFNGPVSSATNYLSEGLTHVFGPQIQGAIYGQITWADLIVAAIPILSVAALNVALSFVFRRQADRSHPLDWRKHLFGNLGGPVYLLLWIGGIYLGIAPLLLKLWSGVYLNDAEHILDEFFGAVVFIASLWLSFRLARAVEGRVTVWAGKISSRAAKFLVPLLGRSLRVFLPVLVVVFALPAFFPAADEPVFARVSSILIILAVAWVLFQAVDLGQKSLLAGYDITTADNLQARKIHTQFHLIGRTLHVLIGICTVASILMLFQEVRHVGASMFASAGIVGIIAGIAAQKTLANFFAGFQIALAQPMRQDDVVIVEGEWGRIEEITLTYVVVHVWDDTRLVLPLTYFIEKPFQNWTRASAQLLGSVFVFVDYTFPVDEARKALKEIVERQPLWDKRFWNLQVSDADEKTMQLRVLATAADSSKAWNLRCEIREQFIAYIQKNYPQCLPRVRADLDQTGIKGSPQNNGVNRVERPIKLKARSAR